MNKQYNIKNIRTLLTEGFTAEELRRLCYDEPKFRPVYDQLAKDTGKSIIIDLLLEHADQKLHLEILLALVQKRNPVRYERHKPYEVIVECVTPANNLSHSQNVTVFQDGGALPADSPVYIERSADYRARRHLQKMNYLTIFEPRQQGKTSLINHLIGYFRPQGYILPYVDLTNLDKSGEAAWYASLYNWLLRKLEFIPYTSRPIQPTNGSNWKDFLENVAKLTEAASCHLVVVLDEIGAVPAVWATDFFTGIRMIYNARTDTPAFKRLTFILAGAYNPNDLIKDPNISPFNVAHPIQLADFDVNQVQQLVAHLPLIMPMETAAQHLCDWTGGQPFLCQRLCQMLAEQERPVTSQAIDDAVQIFIREDTTHLPRLYEHLTDEPELLEYAQQLIREKTKLWNRISQHFRLAHIIGLISADKEGYCCIRNRIYETAFAELLSENSVTTRPAIEPPPPTLPSPTPPSVPSLPPPVAPAPLPPTIRSEPGRQPTPLCLKLELTQRTKTKFGVQIVENPEWEAPPQAGRLPYTPDQLTAILKALRYTQYNSDDFTPVQIEALQQLKLLEHGQFVDLAQSVGTSLYQILVARHRPIEKAVDTLLAEARGQQDIPILQLRFYENGAELARFPWELLYQQSFLLRRRGELIRYISHAAPVESLAVVPPLRLLYIESQAHKLSQGREQTLVRQTLAELAAQGILAVETLPEPTFACLQERLDTQPHRPIHILHFDGHAVFAKQCRACQAMNYPHHSNCQGNNGNCWHPLNQVVPQGYLAFEDKQGQADYVGSRELADLLSYPAIRLAVISACWSSSVRGETVFSSIAPALIQIGIPAVVAMQLPITVEAAIQFMTGFYRTLAEFKPLVAAMNAGRRALLRSEEWFIPTLYLRSRDDEGYLFRRKEH